MDPVTIIAAAVAAALLIVVATAAYGHILAVRHEYGRRDPIDPAVRRGRPKL